MGKIRAGGLYCAYLRKSRRDMELEALGQGETLARHERALADLAARLGIAVTRTYREIVSGDTIAQRPQVQQLLADIGAGLWDGVLVMDVDRLARGDSIDQGIILQSLMYAGVLVVTPDKVYDPADEADAEFFEVKLFFARREYAAIKKRMQRGRVASVMDGCYQGPRIYGYERFKLPGRKGWSLRVIPEEAEIVRSIFAWYADGMDGRSVGGAVIANRLNDMGLRTGRGNPWTASSVRQTLQNPTYAGMIRWNKRIKQVTIRDGQRQARRVLSDSPILADGLHEAIIDRDLFDRVHGMFAAHAKRPRNVDAPVVNPLAGLVICAECGHVMQFKPDPQRREGFLFCPTSRCRTASTYISAVEGVVLDGLRGWVADYEARGEAPADVPPADAAAREVARKGLEEQLQTLGRQRARQYDLLERGVYDVADFQARRAEIDSAIAKARAALADLDPAPAPDPIGPIIPQVRRVLAAYGLAATPADKSALLTAVIDHIIYTKTARCYRNNAPTDNLTLTIFPRVPRAGEEERENCG